MHSEEEILGVSFFTGTKEELLSLIKEGGLLTAPAAPALINLGKDVGYTASLQESDFVITDSGFMVILWFLATRRWIPRLSGLKFLKALLDEEFLKQKGASFWVKPSEEAKRRTQHYLANHGLPLTNSDFYIAPIYPKGPIEDPTLVEALNKRRPPYIFVNIGGGKQEILGLYLKRHLNYSPAIVCTGAAIAFLTGEQVRIPLWADRLILGWFFRCLSKPHIFGKRYFSAMKLIPLLFHYKERAPTYDNP